MRFSSFRYDSNRALCQALHCAILSTSTTRVKFAVSFTRCRNAPVDIAGQIYGFGDDVIDELLKRHAKSCSLRRFNRTVLNCQPRRWFLRFLGGGDSNSSNN